MKRGMRQPPPTRTAMVPRDPYAYMPDHPGRPQTPIVNAAVAATRGVDARSPQVTAGGTTTMAAGRGFGLGLGLDPTQRASIRSAIARGDTASATTIASSARPNKFAKLLAGGSAKAVKARTIFGG